MLINGIDINTLDVKLYDRVLTSNEVQTAQDWLDGDFQPTFVRQQDKFKDLKLSFLVLENDENEAFKAMSKLTALLKKATLRFDDIDCSFDVVLNGTSSPKRLKNGKFILEFNLKSDYGKGDEEIFTTDKSATEYFTLRIMYYMNTNTLVASETKTLRRADFAETGNTFDSIGIDLDKYREQYYQPGIPSNFVGMELNYDNLSKIQALIVNYAPTIYTIDVNHFKLNENSLYDLIAIVKTTFTYPQLLKITTIGELIDAKTLKPEGYIAKIMYDGPIKVEDLLENSPISVYYDKPEVDRQKDIVIRFAKEIDNGSYEPSGEKTIIVKESDIVDGAKLKDFIDVDAYKPSKYYNTGILLNGNLEDLITFDTLNLTYDVEYNRTVNIIHVEYYQGEYPNWFKVATDTINSKVEQKFLEEGYQINLKDDLGIDKDAYLTDVYQPGQIINEDLLITYEDVVNVGFIQVFYVPIDYSVDVRYFQDDMTGDPIAVDSVAINDVMFLSGSTTINDIIDLNKYKPEGYTLYSYYDGEMTLSAILASAPLNIVYGPIALESEKNIVISYKKEMSSGYSTIQTDTITIKQSEVAGGVRLSTLIDVDKYLPEYYSSGIIDAHSLNEVVEFEDIRDTYSILYLAKYYETNVRYFTDEVNDLNWIGSDLISYRIIDFEVGTTLFDLGLNLNLFKPSYCGDGQLQYTGPVSFVALIKLEAINILYVSVEEPGDPDISYPKRFLFIDYNDLKGNENLFPNETFNKAYISTGFTCSDRSKLTMIVETEKIYPSTDLTQVNVGDAFMFGSKGSAADGTFGMKYRNNTRYLVQGQEQMANLFGAYCGTQELLVDEKSAIGFSRNTGIYSTERYGYSFATFTYTSSIQTNAAPVRYPIYLFANNNQGAYADGIAGVGIYGCKIYYDDVLMRDFIPVAFYDKIGDQVAPSNCLYDKVSQTFFEDGRGLNSFKIKDDPDWVPELGHQLGNCFVSYFKGNQLFRTATIWFRGDDFKEPWNMRENFFVDYYQPPYCKPGVIEGAPPNEEGTFASLNGKSFTVRYESLGYNVEANYYKDSIAEENLIATDQLSFEESDFYRNPSFGELININKYKPDGYQTDFKYEGKVVLNQIVENAPYNIVYKPAVDIIDYTTTIKYYEEVKPDNVYLGESVITIDSTEFQEGVFIEKFINFDAMKPLYCESGEPLNFYLEDEELINEDSLRPEYSVIYRAAPQNIELRYYTDVVDEENQIASKNWPIKQNQWIPNEIINLQEALPYALVNAYKPAICLAGVIEEELTTFVDLVEKGYIDIVYTTIKEPTDPEGQAFPRKMIWFQMGDDATNRPFRVRLPVEKGNGPNGSGVCTRRPWIDTGYIPKDLSRLTLEATAYALNEGSDCPCRHGSYTTDDYCYYIGYYGAFPEKDFNKYSVPYMTEECKGDFPRLTFASSIPNGSLDSSGCCAIKGHWPWASGFVYTSAGPQLMDGFVYMVPGGATGIGVFEQKSGSYGAWRKGYISDNINHLGEDWTTGMTVPFTNTIGINRRIRDEGSDDLSGNVPFVHRPYTIRLSPYRNESYVYNADDFKEPKHIIVDEETLNLQERDRDLPCRPVDTLTIFASRNPDTGKINLPTTTIYTTPGTLSTGGPTIGSGGSSHDITVITGKDENGDPIFDTITIKLSDLYESFPVMSNPGLEKAYLWNVKIWDREKLVRDMIPVEEGQMIYDSYVAPSNCLFDKITETFFANQNKGGSYVSEYDGNTYTTEASDVLPLRVIPDPSTYGKITVNYYKDGTTFIGNKNVDVPFYYNPTQTNYDEIFHLNDMNPDERYYNKGRSDYGGLWVDPGTPEDPKDLPTLGQIYELGYINVFYDPIMFEKDLAFYKEDVFLGYSGFSFSFKELEAANALTDLRVSFDAYADLDRYKPGKPVIDNSAFAEKRYDEVIALPTIPVILEKRTDTDNFYMEYFRESASLDYTRDFNINYIDCDLTYKVIVVDGIDGYSSHNLYYNTEVITHYDYKQSIHITKLTSDKTWGLDAEKNAWVETKYLTIGQQTKYLRGLAIDNIDLNTVDWEKTYLDFAEMGIDIQYWKLAYHSDAVNTYEGAYTFEGLKQALGAKFVYPEFIYNYNCLFFKDTLKDTSVPIATKPFSFTIGDFDLDWNNFISTNERYLTRPYFIITANTYGRKEPGVQYESVKELYIGNHYEITLYSDDGLWYYVFDHLDKTYFWVDKTATEEYTPTPSLAGIAKSWIDIGIDANEFKPSGYGDGIMIWNSYNFLEAKDQVVNLQDLITSGGQKVLYPVKTTKYKALYAHSFTKFDFDDIELEENYSYQVRAEHLTTSQHYIGFQNNKFYWGSWFWGNRQPQISAMGDSSADPSDRWPRVAYCYELVPTSNTVNNIGAKRRLFNERLPVFATSIRYYPYPADNIGTKRFTGAVDQDYIDNEDIKSFDRSFYLESGDKYREDLERYGRRMIVNSYEDNELVKVSLTKYTSKIVNSSNEQVPNNSDDFQPEFYDREEYRYYSSPLKDGIDFSSKSENQKQYINSVWIGSGIRTAITSGSIYDSDRIVLKEFKVFDKNILKAWYIPLPKGYPIFGGKMAADGFYDLISGRTTIQLIHRNKPKVSSGEDSYTVLKDDFVYLGKDQYDNDMYTSFPELYHFDANVGVDSPLDYFGEQTYTTEEVFYPAVSTQELGAYKYPDELADLLATYPAGQVMPITRRLVDETWSFNGLGWVKSSSLSRETSYQIQEPTNTKTAIKGDTTTGAWALKLEPLAEAVVNENTADYETVLPIHAVSGEFVWIGKGWLDYKGTSLYYNDISRNVITTEGIACYEYPTLQAKTVKTYILGTQLTLVKELVRDTKWANTGEGWIRTEKTVDILNQKGV